MDAPVLFEQFSALHWKYKITPRGDTKWHAASGWRVVRTFCRWLS